MTGIAMKRCAQCHGKLGLGVRSLMYGTAAGGFMFVIVRLIARRFMSWSDTTPASNVTGTHFRRTDQITSMASPWSIHDAPESQIDRAPPRAHPAPAALRQLSRELPRWKRDHGLLHRQARRRR